MSIRVGLRHFSRSLAKVIPRLTPSANDYWDLVGKIWSQESGGYYARIPGAVAFYYEESFGKGGGYFLRA